MRYNIFTDPYLLSRYEDLNALLDSTSFILLIHVIAEKVAVCLQKTVQLRTVISITRWFDVSFSSLTL